MEKLIVDEYVASQTCHLWKEDCVVQVRLAIFETVVEGYQPLTFFSEQPPSPWVAKQGLKPKQRVVALVKRKMTLPSAPSLRGVS